MNKKISGSFSLLIIGLLLMTSGCSDEELTQQNILEKDIQTFDELRAQFQDPPARYRTAPFWVWNDRVTKEKIDRQLRELKAAGVGGVYVHARMGLVTPYLSDRWNDLYTYTVKKGKELGLKVYLYDENNFPSGFAGGHLPAQMPEAVNQGHALGFEKSDELPGNAAEDYYLVLKRTGNSFDNITDRLGEELNEKGSYYLFYKIYYENNDPWYGGFSYVDLLMEGVTEKFLNITLEGYIEHFGEEFGNQVPAIFADEARARPQDDNSIQWTPTLFEEFEKRWGYDLRLHLPSLFEEVGNWKKVRHNYYTLHGDLFIENWAKPYANYAEKHNLMWTGHHFEHAWPSPRNGGDWAAIASWQHMPGIDVLFNNYSEELEGVNSQFGNARAVRELSSIANQMGRNRTISETYGATGWEFTFSDMKRITDWQYVLGVNSLTQHHSMMSLKGVRKRDYPPSFSYHTPWWEHYDVLGDYSGRLSLALSAGEQQNDILVLTPTTSAWMYYTPRGVKMSPGFYEVGEPFQAFVNQLEALQVEYDLGSERVIRDHGLIKDKQFTIGERSYDLVVLPPGLRNLDAKTAQLIEKYVEKGGEILSIGADPAFIEGSSSDKFEQLKSNADSTQWKEVEQLDESIVEQYLESEEFHITRSESSPGKLFHRRMTLEDGKLLFLVNTSDSTNAAGSVEIPGQSLHKLDPITGEIQPYSAEISENKVQFSFDLSPVGSLLLFVEEEARNQPAAPLPGPTKQEVISPAGSTQVSAAQPNVLVLDYLDLHLGGRETENMFYAEAADSVFSHHGFEHGNPWYRAIQYKTNILDRNNFGPESGFKATFEFSVDGLDQNARSTLQAVVENPPVWEVSINGTQVDPLPNEWWLDREFGVFPIGDYAKEGTNELTIASSPMTVFSELERPFILGNFDVEATNKGWKLVPAMSLKPGSWQEQGMPFYSDKVSYIQHYSLSSIDLKGDFKVRLGDWEGTVAEVFVNGESAGIIGWPPYELDVSKQINAGENEIDVTVYGSLVNLLGPHHGTPREGRISPSDFSEAPDHQPSGMVYRIFDYGLMEKFRLVREPEKK